MSRELTVKQEAFKEAIIAGATPIDAVRAAGYKGNDNTLSQRAFELVRLSKIKQDIAQRKVELAAETGYTVAQCQKEFELARTHAVTLRQPSAEVSAITGKARLFGFDKDASIGPDQASSLTSAQRKRYEDLARAENVRLAKEA